MDEDQANRLRVQLACWLASDNGSERGGSSPGEPGGQDRGQPSGMGPETPVKKGAALPRGPGGGRGLEGEQEVEEPGRVRQGAE